ncbi:hypothetical protein HDU86_003877 [Geranomyces michiganensis]|nr:hypothetical protein HDU86_003877 [Geranomyces michiganensis]
MIRNPVLLFTALLASVAPFVSALPTASSSIAKRDAPGDVPTYVQLCPPPTEADFNNTWLDTEFGQNADVVLKNAAQAYNVLVLPIVHNCAKLDKNSSSALTQFYFDYYNAATTIFSIPDDPTSIQEQSNVRDLVCVALEQVQSVIVELTEAAHTPNGTCHDSPPSPHVPTQIVNLNCNLYPGYQPQDRPFFYTEFDSLEDPDITYLAVGFGCRGDLVARMEKRDGRLEKRSKVAKRDKY